VTEFICCYCPNLFEADTDGPQAECPQCEQVLPTERRDSWEDRDDHDYDDVLEAVEDGLWGDIPVNPLKAVDSRGDS